MQRRLAPLFSLAFAVLCGGTLAAGATLPLNQKPPTVTLAGDAGGRTDGSPWSSDSLKGKVWVLFYVDPDHESANPDLEKALKDTAFPHDKFASCAVINMAATWKPNAIIESVLRGRQEDFPDTIYVRDMDKALVAKWKLTDKDYDVVVFDKQGNVIFAKDGEFTKDDVKAVLDLIRKSISA